MTFSSTSSNSGHVRTKIMCFVLSCACKNYIFAPSGDILMGRDTKSPPSTSCPKVAPQLPPDELTDVSFLHSSLGDLKAFFRSSEGEQALIGAVSDARNTSHTSACLSLQLGFPLISHLSLSNNAVQLFSSSKHIFASPPLCLPSCRPPSQSHTVCI